MFSRHECNIRELSDSVLVSCYVPKLYEGVTPVATFKGIVYEVKKPLAFKDLLCILIFLAVSLSDDKGFQKCLSGPLSPSGAGL